MHELLEAMKLTCPRFTLQDASPTVPSPSFGIVGSTLSTTPLFDLTCPASTSVNSSLSSVTASSSTSGATVFPSAPASQGTSSAISSTQQQSSTITPSSEGSGVPASTRNGPPGQPVTQSTTGPAPNTQIPASTQPQPSTLTSITQSFPAPAASVAACPADLNGAYAAPFLINPVSRLAPNELARTSYYGNITSGTSTIFTFAIPSSATANIYSLILLLPLDERYTLEGQGSIVASILEYPINDTASYATLPQATIVGTTPFVQPGYAGVIASQPGAAGLNKSFLFEATGSLNLTFFEDRGEPAVGAWVRMC